PRALAGRARLDRLRLGERVGSRRQGPRAVGDGGGGEEGGALVGPGVGRRFCRSAAPRAREEDRGGEGGGGEEPHRRTRSILGLVSGPPSSTHSAAAQPPPVYADRQTGQVFTTARAMVDAYLAKFAQRAGCAVESLDESGYTQVRKGSASVGINVLD